MNRPSSIRAALAEHNTMGSCQAKFLDFVERNPACLSRASFAALERPPTEDRSRIFLSHYVPIQPWPLFLDSATHAELGRISVKAFDLVRSLPERLFDNDPQQLCRFYGLDPAVADDLGRVLALPWAAGGESMRGDFILSGGKLKCIEINAGSNAGGIFNFQVAEACLNVPVLRRFLAEHEASLRFTDPWHTFLQLVIERAMARDLHRGGSLNIGFAIPQPETFAATLPYIEPPYEALLSALAPGVRGRIVYCDYDQLRRDGDLLKAGDEPIQILFQHYGDVLMSPLSIEIAAWLDGVIDLYSGPMAWIYKDKRNLALLSEHAEMGRFSAEEASWIAAHIPWSRLIRPGKVRHHGEQIELAELLLAERERFVLKPAQSLGGVGVVVGRFTAEDAWRELVQSVLEDGGSYMAQEYLEPDLQVHQWGENGCRPCEINWGMFVAGQRFGGAYLRVCPPPPDGIINVTNGAEDGCVFEWVTEDEPGDDRVKTLSWSFSAQNL